MKKIFTFVSILAVLILLVSCATPLMKAAKTGNVKTVNALLEQGVDIDERSQGGGTALMWAAHYGTNSIVKLLLNKGADVDAKNDAGWTALHSAVMGGHADIVHILLSRGADVSIAHTTFGTSLQLAEANRNTLISRMLKVAEEEKYKRYIKTEKSLSPQVAKPVLLFSDLLPVPDFHASARLHDLAVIIGIEAYRSVPKSDYSKADAETFKAYLKAMGFQERNVTLLTNDHATLSDIRKTVESWLPNKLKKGGKVFVYYSGHGSPDPVTGEAFIVPYDGDPNYLDITGYPLKRLYEKLGRLQASEVIVVLDSCFSGAGGRSVLAQGARPLVMTSQSVTLPQNMVVLSSTQGSQISTSSQEKSHGIFTYYFLKALKDGKKSVAEIYKHIKPYIEDDAKSINVQQSPSINPDVERLRGRFALRK